MSKEICEGTTFRETSHKSVAGPAGRSLANQELSFRHTPHDEIKMRFSYDDSSTSATVFAPSMYAEIASKNMAGGEQIPEKALALSAPIWERSEQVEKVIDRLDAQKYIPAALDTQVADQSAHETTTVSDARQFLKDTLNDPRRISALTSSDTKIAATALQTSRQRIAQLGSKTLEGEVTTATTLDARLELAGRIIYGLSRDSDTQRRAAALKLLPEIATTQSHGPMLQKVLLGAIDGLRKGNPYGGQADALIEATLSVAKSLPHDRMSGADLVQTWLSYANAFPGEVDRTGIVAKICVVFTDPKIGQCIENSDARAWRNGAIVEVYNGLPEMGRKRIEKIFGIGETQLDNILTQAKFEGFHVEKRQTISPFIDGKPAISESSQGVIDIYTAGEDDPNKRELILDAVLALRNDER